MLMLATSPDALLIGGQPDAALVQVLRDTSAAGNPVGVLSNNEKPAWFDTAFSGSEVEFVKVRARQDGDVISAVATECKLAHHDVIVLAVKADDVHMGKNGRAVLIGAGWSNDAKVKELGIGVANAAEFREVINLAASWPGGWWYNADESWYGVRALCDLSSKYKETEQVEFSDRVTNLVKNGGPKLFAVHAITCRSLMMEGIGATKHFAFGVYPSSAITRGDSEMLSTFTHRVRTTVSRVKFAKKGEPLLLRHKTSTKRSKSFGSVDREDPSEQVETIRVNPAYRNKLKDRTVIVIDDVTTYGVSFGVAAAFLRAAGAAGVIGVALGKFGNRLRYYEIDIASSPYAPVPADKYTVKVNRSFSAGTTNPAAQSTLLTLLP